MERDRNYDLELAKYIWSILKCNPPVLVPWGVDLDTVKMIDRGLQFHMQDSSLTGNVVIVYNEGMDYFDVTFRRGGSPEEVRVYNNIALDRLVGLIDSKVEKTDEYEKRASDTYNT